MGLGVKWDNEQLLLGTGGNCVADGHADTDDSAKVTLLKGQTSKAVYASVFGFKFVNEQTQVEVPEDTDIDTILVQIRSKGAENGKIITDVLRLAKAAALIPNKEVPEPTSKFKYVVTPDHIGACRPWLTTCEIYSSYFGTPEKWGFRGRHVKNETPDIREKHWLTVGDVKRDQFGVVFRCRNTSESDQFVGIVESIAITIACTDSSQLSYTQTKNPTSVTQIG